MHDPMAPIRAEVLAQPEPEQVEYALDLMAYYLAPLPAFYEGCADMGLALANSELRMLHAMDAKRGRYDAAATPEYGSDTLFDYYARLIAGDVPLNRGDHAVF